MKLSPLKRFFLRALAWLPICFLVWWWVSGLAVWVPVKLAGGVLQWLWPSLITGVAHGIDGDGRATFEVLTAVVSMQVGPDGKPAAAALDAIVYPLIYGYSLPLFIGLTLATPQDDDRRWIQVAIGAAMIWLAQAFGIASEALKHITLDFGPAGLAAAHAAGLNENIVALCDQVG
jgi:hypothetical protein